MEAELSEFSRHNKALELELSQRESGLQATTTEMRKERQHVSTSAEMCYLWGNMLLSGKCTVQFHFTEAWNNSKPLF